MLNEQQRAATLDQTLMAMAGQGARVETRSATSAVLVKGKPVNNVLHLLISVLLCGFWVPVWLLLGAFTGERRETVTVDQQGQVLVQKQPLSGGRILLIVLAALWIVLQLVVFSALIAAMGSDTTTAIGLM